ncbi:type IV pilus secretin family protein [Parvibium lacunae]|uniref:Type IV pilus biogenesis and competence protein PilQ n=1 Tax=Parvibium lacunae TaxID=1888893 RepID=A0A368KZ82_9BURK|nr:type IV pilus secretin family protein [Parvibium lacunae]RCS56688.1 type IV pilus secretin family protein [Parvibium lacunae]
MMPLMLLGVRTAAQSQDNAIESIQATQSGSRVVLKIDLKAPLKELPASFSVNSPARIAFDFPATDNASGKTQHEINTGELRTVNVVGTNERTRVVLNLKQSVAYTSKVEGKSLLVTLESAAAQTAAKAEAANDKFRFGQDAASAKNLIKDIDFRRGREGEGRVVVDLSNPQAAIDIRQQGQTVVIDFLKSSLPEKLRRRLDVADFGTPVTSINTLTQGDTVKMVIEPKGLWEHNAYQSDTQFVVEVKPIKEDPNKLVQGTRAGYKGEKLSLNFQNVDIRALLQVIADFTNLNIITSDSVQGNITLRLKDVPWDQALDIIMQAKGLDMRKNNNVLWVAPKDELLTKEKLDLESKSQITDLEPVRSEVFQLNFTKAIDLQKILSDTNNRIVSKRGSVIADQRTNQLFVLDTNSRLDDIRKFIQKVDVATRQVLIEARVVQASDKFTRNIGARLGWNDKRATAYTEVPYTKADGTIGTLYAPSQGAGNRFIGGTYSTISGNLNGVGNLSSQNGAGDLTPAALGLGQAAGSLTDTNFVNLPATGISGASPGSFAISLFTSKLTQFLNLELSALEADSKAKVISSPRVVTADQVKATIKQGEEIPFERATASGATSIEFKEFVLKLDVTPQITPDGNVFLEVEVTKDSRGALVQTRTGSNIPAKDTRSVQTKVLVENGGTVILGGIFEQTESQFENRIPFFGDIPVLGWLFRNQSRIQDKTELLIFITPKIVAERVQSASR